MKKYIVEFLGTFFLTMIVSLTGNPLVIGATLATLVYSGGSVSGGHYNPAVSLAIWMRNKITTKELGLYCITQVLAVIFATGIFTLLRGQNFIALAPENSNMMQISLSEVVFTFLLVYTVLSVAVRKSVEGNQYFGLAIGLALAVGAYAGGPLSGAVYNPAIAIGTHIAGLFSGIAYPALLTTYILSQVLGSLLAVGVFTLLDNEKQEMPQLRNSATPAMKNIIQVITKSLVKKPSRS